MANNVLFREPGTDATQDFSFFLSTTAGGSSTVTSDTSQAFTGKRSIKCTTDNTNDAFVTTVTSVVQDAGTRLSFRFRTSTLPASGKNVIVLTDNGGVNAIMSIGLSAAGLLGIFPGGVTGQNGTTVLSATTWYRITLSYTITSATVWSFKVYLNGVLEVSLSSTGTLSTTGTSIILFVCGAGWGVNASNWFDDIYSDAGSDLSDPGNIQVTAKRPFANGTTNGFTTRIGSGGSGYGTGHAPQVNEQPLNQANGWSMVGAGSAVTEEYNIEGLAVGDVNLTGATIVDVAGWVFAKALVSENAQLIFSGSTAPITLTSTPTLFSTPAGVNTGYPPGTGGDIGLITATTLTTVSLYECGILVSFINPDTQEWIGSYPPVRQWRDVNPMYAPERM